MWIPPEIKDPVLKHHPTRKSVGYFAAIRLRDGKFVYRREPDKFNAQSFWDFMKHLHASCAHSGRRAVVITDNAKYHHARLHKDWRAEVEQALAFEFLPPYSPELNPIERVWKLTRRLEIHNQYFPTLDVVVERVESRFAQWADGSEALRRLCAII